MQAWDHFYIIGTTLSKEKSLGTTLSQEYRNSYCRLLRKISILSAKLVSHLMIVGEIYQQSE